MIKHLTVTEDHLKLIPFIMVEDDDKVVLINKERPFSVQSSALEDLSLILGLRDKAVSGTENDAEGRAFPQEVEEYMMSLYRDFTENLLLWESLIHQFVCQGGLTVGEYKCKDSDLLWEKVVD